MRTNTVKLNPPENIEAKASSSACEKLFSQQFDKNLVKSTMIINIAKYYKIKRLTAGQHAQFT